MDLIEKRSPQERLIIAKTLIEGALQELPCPKPETAQNVSNEDLISRKMAIEHLMDNMTWYDEDGCESDEDEKRYIIEELINGVPSAQPERTYVNCGRTANNGGWYADGRTRCPIEEHYALPKDGYCHLWEKRNVTDDDYPERREE